jgi:putative ATP-dependent endonuclease of OLD family
MVARLTYRFQPKANLGRDPESLADYEYIIFGGDDPEMSIGSSSRRMLPLDVQVALRDAEKDLASWRNSPLRPSRSFLPADLPRRCRRSLKRSYPSARRHAKSSRDGLMTPTISTRSA